MEAVVQALGLSCESVAQRTHCQSIRPSGARFEAVAPDGTVTADRELSFSASGPTELESEARRLFAAVANAVTGDPELSRAWQDQIWAAFDDPQVSTAALPNGANWTASRQEVGDVLIWSLRLTSETSP